VGGTSMSNIHIIHLVCIGWDLHMSQVHFWRASRNLMRQWTTGRRLKRWLSVETVDTVGLSLTFRLNRDLLADKSHALSRDVCSKCITKYYLLRTFSVSKNHITLKSVCLAPSSYARPRGAPMYSFLHLSLDFKGLHLPIGEHKPLWV
jgi:hypothetical protein